MSERPETNPDATVVMENERIAAPGKKGELSLLATMESAAAITAASNAKASSLPITDVTW